MATISSENERDELESMAAEIVQDLKVPELGETNSDPTSLQQLWDWLAAMGSTARMIGCHGIDTNGPNCQSGQGSWIGDLISTDGQFFYQHLFDDDGRWFDDNFFFCYSYNGIAFFYSSNGRSPNDHYAYSQIYSSFVTYSQIYSSFVTYSQIYSSFVTDEVRKEAQNLWMIVYMNQLWWWLVWLGGDWQISVV